MPGTLFLVATPIGNLEDITLRALRVLREVALVAAEDTRRTARLLAHFDIATPLLSLHEHNERTRTPSLVARLAAGESLALVTDAGTPLVSDPGAALVSAALEAGVRVEAIPGASAVLAALVASGLPADTFTFMGFAPSRAGERRAWLRALGAEPRAVVCFEAPHRVREMLREALGILGDRPVAVGRELTKLHEEVIRGSLSAVLDRLGEPRGEFTLVFGPAGDAGPEPVAFTDRQAWADFLSATSAEGLDRRAAVAALARRYGVPSRDVYAAIERGRAEAGDTVAR
jgi:16S rRNA (cytidine1402-2'-O)-methyltransferase